MPGLDTTLEMITHFQRLAEHDKASLARELHDELGGLLIGAVMDLSILAQIAPVSEDVLQRAGRIRQALRSAIELTRRITEQLRPTLLDNVGLFAALRWQLRTACAKTEISCADDLPATELRLTPNASISLFRSVQEALLIGLGRRGVTAIELIGTLDDDALSIQLLGDGAILGQAPNDLGPLIVESIRHRMRPLGGAVCVDYPAHGGIIVEVRTPIANVLAPAPN